MPESQELDLNQQLVQLLLDKIEGDTYPSTTMMDMVEELPMDDRAADRYAQILLTKATSDTYPSYAILERIRTVAEATSEQ